MNIVDRTIEFVKSELHGAESGHDWWHSLRVYQLSRIIAEKEGADLLICDLGALLHDIADPKFHDGDETRGSRLAYEFLQNNSLRGDIIKAVIHIIQNISFSKSFEYPGIKSLELQVVQDADRLDAIGAIGIARAFSYGGFRSRPLYDPSVPPARFTSTGEYRKSTSPTINHFHEKLLKLKDMMNTETGKAMAAGRHEFMLEFLKHFHDEWNGKI